MSILLVLVILGCSEKPKYVPQDGPFGLAMGMMPDDPWFQNDSTKLDDFNGTFGTLRRPPLPYPVLSEYKLAFGSKGLCFISSTGTKVTTDDFARVVQMIKVKYGEPLLEIANMAHWETQTSEPLPANILRIIVSETGSSSKSINLDYFFVNYDHCVQDWRMKRIGADKNPF